MFNLRCLVSLIGRTAVVHNYLLWLLDSPQHRNLFTATHELDISKPQVEQSAELVAVTFECPAVIEFKLALAVLFYGEFARANDVVAIQIFAGKKYYLWTAVGAGLDACAEVRHQT